MVLFFGFFKKKREKRGRKGVGKGVVFPLFFTF